MNKFKNFALKHPVFFWIGADFSFFNPDNPDLSSALPVRGR